MPSNIRLSQVSGAGVRRACRADESACWVKEVNSQQMLELALIEQYQRADLHSY